MLPVDKLTFDHSATAFIGYEPGIKAQGVVILMTMSTNDAADLGHRRAFGIITVQGRVLDLSDLLSDGASMRVSWNAHAKGPLFGLSATAGEHEASVSWASPAEALHETSSENAPNELVTHARETYVAYVLACLRLGEFQLEATPVTDHGDGITARSLRARLVERGAGWLADLPAPNQGRFARIPRASEVAMVDVPEDPSSQLANLASTEDGEPS